MCEGLVIRTEDPTCKCWVKDNEAQTLCTLKIKKNNFLPHSPTTTAAQKRLLNVDDCAINEEIRKNCTSQRIHKGCVEVLSVVLGCKTVDGQVAHIPKNGGALIIRAGLSDLLVLKKAQ